MIDSTRSTTAIAEGGSRSPPISACEGEVTVGFVTPFAGETWCADFGEIGGSSYTTGQLGIGTGGAKHDGGEGDASSGGQPKNGRKFHGDGKGIGEFFSKVSQAFGKSWKASCRGWTGDKVLSVNRKFHN